MDDELMNNDYVDQFESMLENNDTIFFDSEQMCEIIAFYLEIGDYEYAQKALEYAYQLYPDNTNIQIKELEYYIYIDELVAAAEMIRKLRDLAQNDLDYLLAVAKYWSLKNNPKLAIQFYQKALMWDEELDYIYNCIGSEYLHLDALSSALVYFKKSLDENPQNEFAFYSAIQCYEELHQTNECIEFLNHIIDQDPYNENAWYQLGTLYSSQKKYQEALRAFDFVTIINPQNISGYNQKAFCFEQLQDYTAAILEYQEILPLDDTAAFTYIKIGECYKKLKQPFKALQAFHKAIHDDPQLEKAWICTSDLYESLGNYQDAMYYLDRALDLDANVSDYRKRHAYLNIQLGQYEEAIQDYQFLTEHDPLNLYNWLGMVETLIAIGDYSRAVETIHKGLVHFNRAELLYQLSNCYYLLNEEEKGLNAFQLAVRLDESLKVEMYKKYPILFNRTSFLFEE